METANADAAVTSEPCFYTFLGTGLTGATAFTVSVSAPGYQPTQVGNITYDATIDGCGNHGPTQTVNVELVAAM
jgi:hypothetical protein